MIATAADIDRLAELAGIEPTYRDYFGRETTVSEATKRAFLSALGFSIDTPQGVAEAVEMLELRPWRRALEPLALFMEGAVARIALTLPATETEREIAWRLVLENGASHEGTARFGDLAIGATRDVDGLLFERRTVDLGVAPPLGYHRLVVDGAGESTVIVAPARCYLPPAIERGAKVWGLAVQLYSLRSRRNWGMGDFGDLEALAGIAERSGAAAIGLNPLHHLDWRVPSAASPYSPSSRQYLNALYIDVERVPDFAESEAAQRLAGDPAFRKQIADARASTLIDYATVGACKREALELAYLSFRDRHLRADTERAIAFRAFVADGGAPLERLATFEALRERFWDRPVWKAWPTEFQDPDSPAVAQFRDERRDRVDFFLYLQWNADLQLGAAAHACNEMEIGLYRDLAVGGDAGGASGWDLGDAMVGGVTVGAPADELNVIGQNWGIAPLSPLELRERAYRPFVDLIRANMRHSGALRIDHAMSLQRLFWIPPGRPAPEGAYVRYPFSELLAILALESVRNECLVVGEDLGTVPEGFSDRLQRARIFSCRLLYFERNPDGSYASPDDFPPFALVSPGTHDLPTLPAFWTERDLELRADLGLLPPATTLAQARLDRRGERPALIDAFVAEGRLAHDVAEQLRAAGAAPSASDLQAMVEAAYRYLARTRARLLMGMIEDVLGVFEQINVPGTISEHPNWSRKLPVAIEDLASDERFARFAASLHGIRAQAAPPTVPTSTYRLQFHREFTFTDAASITPYLAELGISHVYASPFLAARAGSTHGYDIIDHGNLNPDVGSRADFERFIARLHGAGMGLILDFVPNHMGVGAGNPWWQDILEWGRSSPYAPYFDIDWNPARRELRGKVLLPFLGAPYGEVIERGELQLRFDAGTGAFAFAYADHRFPLALRSYAEVLRAARDAAGWEGPPALDGLAAAFKQNWTPRSHGERTRIRERAAAARKLLASAATEPAMAAAIDAGLARLNGTPGDPKSFDALHKLIGAQHYRPAFWRVALDEINYRRFFDINDLAGLRIEYAECFATVHRLAFRLIEDGLVQGLRIDHVDGLSDPKAYTTLLRARSLAMDHPFYLVVEKILARHEALRDDWLVAGTTGYEFANLVNGLFVDSHAEGRVDLMYRAFTGQTASFDDVLLACKRRIMDVNLAAELEVLANELDRIAQSDVRTSDLTRNVLRNALADVVAAFPVYRTYVNGDGASAEDRRYIDWAVAQARKRSEALDRDVFDFIGSVLTTDVTRDERSRYRKRDVLHFAMKFQQYTAPVMAKALEDTSFYRYPRLLSLNEVGGDPRRFGVAPSAFHRSMRERAVKTPYALSTTSTHDTKRGEDARLRIDALTELPSSARRALVRLARINRRHKRDVDGSPAPDRLDEWLLYETLIGTWPLEQLESDAGPIAPPDYSERIDAYMRKATREAKRQTSWANPGAAYEAATSAFVHDVLASGRDSPFWSEFSGLARRAGQIAMVHGLSQLVLKLTAPGVPDVYQGGELWDFNLVDPDNRRPVDWALRRRLCAGLPAPGHETAEFARTMLKAWQDGRVKLFVTRTLLRLRCDRREMFLNDNYVPLETTGEWADCIVAFQRRETIVAVPRLVSGPAGSTGAPPLGAAWGNTQLIPTKLHAQRTYRNAFTGARLTVGAGAALSVAQMFADFPVAVLVPEDE